MAKTRTVVITVTAKYVNGDIPMESIMRYVESASLEMQAAARRNLSNDVTSDAEIKIGEF